MTGMACWIWVLICTRNFGGDLGVGVCMWMTHLFNPRKGCAGPVVVDR